MFGLVFMRRIIFTCFSVLWFQLIKVDALKYANRGCVSDYGNYTLGSVYQQNLNLLLSDISVQASSKKFYNSTIGESPDKVHGLFQCRQDLSLDICKDCIQDAQRKIVQVCPLYGEAIVWYDECMLRYANRSISSLDEIYPSSENWATNNFSNYAHVAPVLAETMKKLISDAVDHNTPSGYFATREANLTLFDKLYTLAQCTPDINTFGCNSCLMSALAVLNSCCNASIRAADFMPSCHLRYDTAPFYDVENQKLLSPPPLSNPSHGENAGKSSRVNPSIIAGSVAAGFIGLVLLVAVIWLCLCRKKPKKSLGIPHGAPHLFTHLTSDGDDSLGEVDFVQYDLATLKVATGDFSVDNRLGEGGFGVVYKGTLTNGQEIAVKRLSGNSGQGQKEFRTEARLVAKLQHKNLVKLVGFCSDGDEKLLVYEFMPNKSVDRFLTDPTKKALLDWGTRYKIIMGIARGMQYLHEDSRLTIIHRDLKTGNILLDKDMNPKIADFGTAKLFGAEQKLGNTSRIVGTHGYMAPEYFLTGEYSDKSDVYSFGVIVLEIVSGHMNRNFYQSPQNEDLPNHAWKLWNAGRHSELADSTLHNNCSHDEVSRCIQIGMLCVQANSVHRPTMGGAVLMLTGSVVLPPPSSPVMSYDDTGFSGNQKWQNVDGKVTSNSVTWSTEDEQDLYPR